MIANDYGYEYVFSRLLDVYAEEGDLVILFSWSGQSKNISEVQIDGLQIVEIFGRSHETPQDAENRHLSLAHEISSAL
jgi:phosphoheptose isomerase